MYQAGPKMQNGSALSATEPWSSLATSAQGFKEGAGVVGVRTQCYMASYWPADWNHQMRD